jgi:hypothetical protein
MKRPPYGWCGKRLSFRIADPVRYCTECEGHVGQCFTTLVPLPEGLVPVEREPVLELEPSARQP